ncbi:hypothetical protein B9Z19DRAFT_1077164 [Tuber borchii]|uniref:Uncharacterized protein n=1 Tax=Tuber borchii TaxID=42251 RepID=A0A2T7A0X8_TUBBO|nr:hypothetical protein B9Z19DRAFT_1077164 [Tuber borchii]
MVWRGNVEERLRGGMAGVENVEEWSKRRNVEEWLEGERGGKVKRRDGWSGECGGMVKEEEGLKWRKVWRGNVEERLRGGIVGVENVEEWFKRRNGWRGKWMG